MPHIMIARYAHRCACASGAQDFLLTRYKIKSEPNLLASQVEKKYIKPNFGHVYSWHAAVLIHQMGRSIHDVRIMKSKNVSTTSLPVKIWIFTRAYHKMLWTEVEVCYLA